MDLLLEYLGYLIQIYSYLILAYVLVGYFPDVRHTRFYQFLENLCEPWVSIFRFATFSGISFAPFLAVLSLQLIYALLTVFF